MSKVNYGGFFINEGHGLHPGSGPASAHNTEYNIFQEVLNRVNNKDNPVMVELGCHWALWSLCFKYRYNNGTNILVELLDTYLKIGIDNFNLNGYDFKSYHGGIFADDAHALSKMEFTHVPNSKKLNLSEILNENKIKVIDILHMDIQGSELSCIKSLKENGLLKNNINQLVIATHSVEIHSEISNILELNGFKIFTNVPHGGLGGDGLLTAKKDD